MTTLIRDAMVGNMAGGECGSGTGTVARVVILPDRKMTLTEPGNQRLTLSLVPCLHHADPSLLSTFQSPVKHPTPQAKSQYYNWPKHPTWQTGNIPLHGKQNHITISHLHQTYLTYPA
jgi:hypothetical protein